MPKKGRTRISLGVYSLIPELNAGPSSFFRFPAFFAYFSTARLAELGPYNTKCDPNPRCYSVSSF